MIHSFKDMDMYGYVPVLLQVTLVLLPRFFLAVPANQRHGKASAEHCGANPSGGIPG